jgi:peptidoglycan DL-endopeptidase CwlO
MAQLLKPGTQGEPIKQLQSKLRQLGFQIEADGHFGPATRAAVEDLQAFFGYDVDGVVGDATQKLIDQQVELSFNVTSAEAVKRGLEAQGQKAEQGFTGPKLTHILKTGSEGPEVRYLQHRLVALGYHLTIDGKFGPATEEAVRALQQAFNYDVDGVVGDGTSKLIYQQIGYGYRARASNA